MVVTKRGNSLVLYESSSRKILGSITIRDGDTWYISGEDICIVKTDGTTYAYDSSGKFKNSFR